MDCPNSAYFQYFRLYCQHSLQTSAAKYGLRILGLVSYWYNSAISMRDLSLRFTNPGQRQHLRI
jgi:hypothetical protein